MHDDRANDLEFIRELREESMSRLLQIRANLAFGGPRWQIIAVDRAINIRSLGTYALPEPP